MPPRLTKAAFRRWLYQQAPGHVMGERLLCEGCPLAIYLNTVRQEQGCWVGERTWYDGHGTRHRLPRWAQAFVARLDAAREIPSPVTAWQVLTILEEIP